MIYLWRFGLWGRRVFALEIEPAYVDVSVTRWEDLTGRKAKRLNST